jgi:hypothetical protein
MKHASIRELFDYWQTRRGARPAPERSEIEPGAIRSVLADTFMLSFDPSTGHPFRIAGTRVCAAFGRELKGVGFTEIWAAASRDPIRELLATVATETIGVVAGASGRSHEGTTLGSSSWCSRLRTGAPPARACSEPWCRARSLIGSAPRRSAA